MVEGASDDERRFAVGAAIHVDGRPARVVLSRRAGAGRRAIKLDRPVVRGQELAVPAEELAPLPEGEFYAFQLVGLRVEEAGGRVLGVVRELLPGAANDNLELEDGTLVPMVEDAVAAIELERGLIVLNPGFLP